MRLVEPLRPFNKSALYFIVIILTSFIVYSNALFNGFVSDDNLQLLNNPWIKHAKYIPEIFLSNFWGFQGENTSLYRPLPAILYMMIYHICGLKAWGFHLLNILFHTANSIFVFLIASSLFSRTRFPASFSSSGLAFFTAVLFATHPIHTEAVAWAGGMMDVSFTFFFLTSFYSYMRGTGEDRPSKATYLFSVVSFFLAALCKEPALTLPAILAAYDYAYKKEGVPFSHHVKRYIPFAVAAGIYLMLRLNALKGFAPTRVDLGLTLYEYAINILILFGKYLEKLILPINLNFWHVFHPATSLLTWRGIASLIIALAFAGILVISMKKSKTLFLCLLLIAAPLLPALYIPALTQGLENAFTERYLYLPSLGFVLILAYSIGCMKAHKPKWAMPLIATCLVLVGLYASGTIKRNFVWKDSYSLWSDAQRKSPDSAAPYMALGDVFQEKGWIEKAIGQYQAALRLRPNWTPIHISLGDAYAAKGVVDRGIEYYNTALELKPDSTDAHNRLGLAYWKKGLVDQAIEHYQTALRLSPQLQGVHNNLGLAYASKGWIDKAIEEYEEALKADPDSAGVHNNLGNAYESKGWIDRAITHYQEALRLQPDYVDAHNNLGIAFGQKGLLDKAVGHFEIAARLNPKDPDIYRNLAKAYKLKGLPGKAEEYLQKAERAAVP